MIKILPKNSKEEVTEGLIKVYDFLNTYIFFNGKSEYVVNSIVIYEEGTKNIIGKSRWITTQYNSNNTTKGIQIDGLKLKRTTAEVAMEKGGCFAISEGRDNWSNELRCSVYIPLSELQGDIVVETEKRGYKEYECTYYVEGQFKVAIKNEFIREVYDLDRELDIIINELQVAKKLRTLKDRQALRDKLESILNNI